MPSVVGVHGIGQQFKGPNVLWTEWLPAGDGLWLAGVEFPRDDDLMCAFYGDLFRPPGTKAVGIPPYDANDVTDDWEKELLEAWQHSLGSHSGLDPFRIFSTRNSKSV